MKDTELRNMAGLVEIKGLKRAFDVGDLQKDYRTLSERKASHNKIAMGLETAIGQCGLRSGMTISFPHRFCGGDYIVNIVMDKLGLCKMRRPVREENHYHHQQYRAFSQCAFRHTGKRRGLCSKAGAIVRKAGPARYTDKALGVVTCRDGSIIDLIRQVA
jgi:citrate lyase alpha subunit